MAGVYIKDTMPYLDHGSRIGFLFLIGFIEFWFSRASGKCSS